MPFKLQVPTGKKDEKLVEKLKSETPGILNWMLDGLEDYRRDGLQEPAEIEKLLDEYRAAEDWLQRFLDSETVVAAGPEQRTQAETSYSRFKTWAEEGAKNTSSRSANSMRRWKRTAWKAARLTTRSSIISCSETGVWRTLWVGGKECRSRRKCCEVGSNA